MKKIKADHEFIEIFGQKTNFNNELFKQQYLGSWNNGDYMNKQWVTRIYIPDFDNMHYNDCLLSIIENPEFYQYLPEEYKDQQMELAAKLA